jgi:hypothetical protein
MPTSGASIGLSELPSGNNNIGNVDLTSIPTVDELILNNQTVANSTLNSTTADIRNCTGAALEIVYTGSSLQGTIKVQCSWDDSNWVDFPNSGSSLVHTISASGGNAQWYLSNLHVPYIRLSVISTDSDTVTVTRARVFAKGA